MPHLLLMELEEGWEEEGMSNAEQVESIPRTSPGTERLDGSPELFNNEQ